MSEAIRSRKGRGETPRRRIVKDAALARSIPGPVCYRCLGSIWTDWWRADEKWRRQCRGCQIKQTHRSDAKPPRMLPHVFKPRPT